MTLQNILLFVFGAAVVIAALRIFRAPLRLAVKILLNTVLGFAILIIFDIVSTYTGISLGVNLTNSLVIGVLGAPGFGLLLMARWLLVL
jgi:inhibitor of the pro-sigma K processing machinery